MMRAIQNFQSLATSKERTDALEIVESAFASIDTKAVLHKAITVDDGVLTVGGTSFVLADYTHIYIIGFGKVSCRAAFVLEELLEGQVSDGAVVGIKEVSCTTVHTYAGTHPLPSHVNFTATKHIEEIAKKATAEDLVLVVVSGGGSALLCSSLEECEQGQKLYTSFLQSGGTIEELNVVRKHISHLKGGGLAKVLYPATVVSLIFSDVPGGDMASIASGPTFQSRTQVRDAEAIIAKYNLGSYRLNELPSDERYFTNITNVLVASNVTALQAMEQTALRLGYMTTIASATHYANPEETIALLQSQTFPGSVCCMGGETKLTVTPHATGVGGRNTHLALSMLPRLKEGEVFVSFASDGKDNCSAAGGIVDMHIQKRLADSGLLLDDFLSHFDSYTLLQKLGGLIETSPLESNVADLLFLLSPVQ